MKKINYLFFILFGMFIFSVGSAKAITTGNALSRLEVECVGGSPFALSGNGTSKTYSWTLYRDSEDVNIIATPASDTYKVEGAGVVKTQMGQNAIVVKVTDPSDNSTVTYTINLNRLAESSYNGASTTTTANVSYDKTTSKNVTINPNTGIMTNIVLLIGISLIALIAIKSIKKDTKFFRI